MSLQPWSLPDRLPSSKFVGRACSSCRDRGGTHGCGLVQAVRVKPSSNAQSSAARAKLMSCGW